MTQTNNYVTIPSLTVILRQKSRQPFVYKGLRLLLFFT